MYLERGGAFQVQARHAAIVMQLQTSASSLPDQVADKNVPNVGNSIVQLSLSCMHAWVRSCMNAGTLRTR